MKFTILDTIEKVNKRTGKPFVQAACRGAGKSGPYLFIATVPPELSGMSGEDCDLTVVFGQNSNFILPY